MSSDTPIDTLPLDRLIQCQQHVLYHARQFFRPDLMFCGSMLTFRPNLMKRVAEEAPVLTDPARLKAAQIRVPERTHRSSCEWTMQVDMDYLFDIGGSTFFGEFTMYTQGTLGQLTDPNPFRPAPRMSIMPPFYDLATNS